LGKALGARVIAAASSTEKLDFCLSVGADAVINYRSEDLLDRVNALTDGGGADVVFDPVGGDLGRQAVGSIARLGRYCLVGFASGSWAPLGQQDMVIRNYSTVGVFAGTMTENELAVTFADLARLAGAGLITTSIGHVFAFDEVLAALAAQEAGDLAGRAIVSMT
jgi:NADPH2:quinone reductase